MTTVYREAYLYTISLQQKIPNVTNRLITSVEFSSINDRGHTEKIIHGRNTLALRLLRCNGQMSG